MKTIIQIIFFICSTSGLLAQTCCSGGVPVSSNLGFDQGSQGLLQLSIGADFNKLATLYDGSTSLKDELRLRTTQSYIARAAYNINDRFGIEGFLPLVRQTRAIQTNGGAEDIEATFGIGDPIVMLYYDVVQSPLNLRVAAGPQIPLGSYTEQSSRGLTLLEDLQPGSGAWDLVFMTSLQYQSIKRPTMSLYLNGILSITGANKNSRNGLQTYEFGDDIQLIAGLNDQTLLFGRVVNPGISMRYRKAQRDKINNMDGTGTGGEWLFGRLSLGIEFIKQSLLTFNYELPVYTFVNETQLSPDRIVNISWSKTIDLSKKNKIQNIINI